MGKGDNEDRNGDGNGESGPSVEEQGRERKKGRQVQAGRTEGSEAKKVYPSVGNVQPYGTAYKWEGTNYIRHLPQP